MVDDHNDTKKTEYSAAVELNYLQRRDLDAAMADVLALRDGRQPSQQGMHLWVFTRQSIRQFNLQRTYSEAHILNTAYLRAVEAIEDGKCITSPYGWLRSAAYNYIRECDRDRKKKAELNEECFSNEWGSTHDNQRATPENITKLEAALQKLTSLERKILQLKVVDGKSWKAIQAELEATQLGSYRVDTLRKQKSRTLRKLRRYFKAL